MNKILQKALLIAVLAILPALIKADEIKLNSNSTSLKLISSSQSEIVMESNISKLDIEKIQNGNTDYIQLFVDGYSNSELIAYPQLPQLNKLIEIPQKAEPRIEIISIDSYEYSLKDLGFSEMVFPCQGPQSKCSDDEAFKKDNNAYSTDKFNENAISDIESVGTLRSQRMALISLNPIKYNPVQGKIKVYSRIKFKVVFENADYALTNQVKSKYYSPFFTGMQKSILNYIPTSERENMTKYPVKYVIVSPPQFESNLQSLIDWKKQKGFTVVEAYTDEVGTTKEAIKTYLQGLYDNGTAEDPAPSFVLFVGDIDVMPTWDNGNGVTDRNYVEYTGDLMPEIFYGRMSVENAAQLDIMINKTLQYEKYTMPDPTYLDEVVMVAGADASHGHDWGNGQINYGTINYFNEEHDITSHTYLYPESENSSAQIIQDISNGVTFANYTAHCSPNGWASPSFVISDISTLDNQDKYGLLIGNCCSSSEFQTTCFAEEIVRAEDKGAVGYIGGSNSTYWDEDYYFGVGVGTISENPPSYEETTLGNYDRAFHDHGEEFGEWYTTMDQHVFAGNLAVQEGSPSSAEYYWDIYNLIGDPSLMVYYSNPDVMPVSHDEVITIGQTSFTVETEPFAYCALNKDGVNYTTALADENGTAELIWDGFTSPGNAELVITAQNKQPWIEDILVFAPNGPFCIYESHIVQDDSLGNGNGLCEYNENFFFRINIKNYGTENANGVNVNLSTESNFANIFNNNANYDTIDVDENAGVDYAFRVHLTDDVPDQQEIQFNITVSDENDSTWTSHFKIKAFAPDLQATKIIIDDSESGNDNGILDPGESALMKVETKNFGHCVANNVTATLIPYNQYVEVISNDTVFNNVGMFMPCYAIYNVNVADDAPEGIFAEMHYQLQSAGYDETTVFYPKISQLIEDWETGDFNKYDWQQDGDADWEITMEYPYEGYYHAVSGEISDNATSEFKITYEVMAPDSISFMRKVSTEADYDKLKFLIDNNVVEEWSGSSPWKRKVYAVQSGIHTFKWVYEKDYAQTGGSDKVWVDYIKLPTMMVTTLFAGPDDFGCSDSYYHCYGSATNYDSIWWSTSGSGTFENINSLYAHYLPSEDDIINKSLVLTLNILDVDGISYQDDMTLTFTEAPVQAYRPEGPAAIDLHQTSSSEYSTLQLENTDSYQWVINPVEAGVVEGDSQNIIINWNTDFQGEVYLKVAGENMCGAGEFSDSLLIVLSNPVGLEEIFSDDISVLPNPNNGSFNVKFNHPIANVSQLYIVNQIGQLIYSTDIELNTSEIKINNINPGLYMLFIKADKTIGVKKILVK